MRKIMLSALMMTLVLLTGCGGENEADFLAFRQGLLGAASVYMEADITAESGGASRQYTLSCLRDSEEVRVAVLAPESIAGIEARCGEGWADMVYDGMELCVASLTPSGLTPVSALPAVLAALRDGHAGTLWREDGALAADIFVSDDSSLTLWLDGESLVPLRCELAGGDGRVIIYCGFTAWEYRAE